jgi:hypothetical protein
VRVQVPVTGFKYEDVPSDDEGNHSRVSHLMAVSVDEKKILLISKFLKVETSINLIGQLPDLGEEDFII